MSGHVFHPGHSELHGITVVVETTGDTLYVGRYHEETAGGVLLHDVAEHREIPGGQRRDEFLRKTLTFGVRVVHPHLSVPLATVQRISRLIEWGEPKGR